MREIKFRIWEIDKSSFQIISFPRDIYKIIDSNGNYPKGHFEQFTGISDTNEVEIYEGDIIDFDNLLGNTQRGFICFRDGCFRISNKLGVMNSYDTEIRMWNDGNNEWYSIENLESFDIEVIGNIHQNPELLK